MKLLHAFYRVRPIVRSSLLRRNIATGLFFVSAKALKLQPNTPSALAISSCVKDTGEQLHVYDVLQCKPKVETSGIALSVIGNLTTARQKGFQSLAPLPPLSREKLDDGSTLENESSELPPNYKPSATHDKPLPPELLLEAMDDDLPEGDPDDAIQDTDHNIENLVDLKQCPDFDPNIPEDAMDDPDMVKNTLNTYDAVDMKKCDNWSSDQDPELQFFNRDVQGWIKSDIEECVKGAKPRLYTYLDFQIKPVKGVVISADYDPSPISSSSGLSPYILVYQVPCPPNVNAIDSDEMFGIQFEHFAYLTSHEHFRRISCFKHDQPSMPHWLVVQEFTELPAQPWRLALKKREAEYWWRKNGWDGVLIEFFHHIKE